MPKAEEMVRACAQIFAVKNMPAWIESIGAELGRTLPYSYSLTPPIPYARRAVAAGPRLAAVL